MPDQERKITDAREVLGGQFSQKAHPDIEEFRRRWEFGMQAQRFIIAELAKIGIQPLDQDEDSWHPYDIAEKPKPDLEFQACFIEIRRQNIFDPILLGHTKKLDGWRYHAHLKQKTLYFVMLTKDMQTLGILNLTRDGFFVYQKENPWGDIDYCIAKCFLDLFPVDQGLAELIKIIQNPMPYKTPSSLKEIKKEGACDWF